MTAPTITLDAERASYRPGEDIRGTVQWSLDAAPSTGTLSLQWRTSGVGVRDERVARSYSLADLASRRAPASVADAPYRATAAADEPAPLAAEDARSFRFGVPEAPYSFDGKLISVKWELCLLIDGERTIRRVIVSPTRAIYELG